MVLVGEGRWSFRPGVLEGLLEQAKQLKQISAGVAAIDKQNELMGFKI